MRKTSRVITWCILTDHACVTRRIVSIPGLSGVLHASLSQLISPIYPGNIENAYIFTVFIMDCNFSPLGLFLQVVQKVTARVTFAMFLLKG